MAATHQGARHSAAPTFAFSSSRRTIRPRLLALAVQSALLSLLGAPLSQALAQSSAPASAPAVAQAPAAPVKAGDGAKPRTAAELSEIVVKAKADEAASRAGTSTVIGARELGARNVADMADMARYAPLISVPGAASGSGNIWDGAGNTGFNIRGVEGNRISLEVDGISLPDAAPKPDGTTLAGFGVARDYFDPQTFREVRIGSGTTPAGAGAPGLGGSVMFVTKSPDDYLSDSVSRYADYSFGYNSANASKMHALTGAAQLGPLRALAVLVHRDGAQADSKGSVNVNPDDWHSDSQLIKFNWALATGHKLGFTIDNFDTKHARSFDNKQGASYPDGAKQDSHTKRTRYSVEHQYTPSGFALFDTLDSRLYTQDAKVEDQTRARYVSRGQTTLRNIQTGFYNKSDGLGLDASKQLNAAALLAYGLSWEQQDSRRPWREDSTVVSTGAHQIMVKNRMVDMRTDRLAAYLRGELSFNLGGHGAVLAPGLRGERRKLSPNNLQGYVVALPGAAKEIGDESDFFLTPSLSLSVELTPNFNAYAQYSRGTRLPTAAERSGTYDSFSYTGSGAGYAVLGNANLKKETSNAVELGLKGAPAAGVELSAALFHTRYDNFIEYAAQEPDPVNYPTLTYGLFRPENVGQASTWGGEVSSRFALGQWSAPLKGYSLLAAAGMQRSSARNTQSGKRSELASTLPYKASLTLAYDDPALRGGFSLSTVHVRAKQAREDVIGGVSAERFAIPSSTVLDLASYWNLGKHASLHASVNNLTDRKYWDYASSRALPAGTNAATLADIERQVRPGRNYALNLKVIY